MPSQQFPDIAHALLASGSLLDRAEDALHQTLASHPNNDQALWRLGQICRSQGKFQQAAEAYQRFAVLHPDHQQAAYLCAILGHRDVPVAAPQTGLWPVPFVYMPQFLSQAQHAHLFEFVSGRQDMLEPAGITRKEKDLVDVNARSSLFLRGQDMKSVRSWFLAHLHASLPTVISRLQMTPFDPGGTELQMTVHRSGDFFSVHRDREQSLDESGGRRLSYVYYFHRTPKCFTGGDLLLYDTDVQAQAYSAAFTRVVPQDNSIIFFPSHYWHQVTPVDYATDNSSDGRFTVNGWIHAAKQ